jgi:hypothetical protein
LALEALRGERVLTVDRMVFFQSLSNCEYQCHSDTLDILS